VGTSLKHFAVNNQEHRRMTIDVDVDERALREIYLASFENAVKNAQPWTVMCSYNKVRGVKCSEYKYFLKDILKDEWGFEGFVVSDWGSVNERVDGLAAGLELEMPASNGIGEKKTPTPFIAACNKFTYIEVLSAPTTEENPTDVKVNKEESFKAVRTNKTTGINLEIISLITTSISDVANDDGWAFLAEVGSLIIKKKPDFDPRNYGFIKLTPLIKTLAQFEIDERKSSKSKFKNVYVRNK
jgi:Fe-S-cluster formation regulator IscX/YfhJ